MSSEKRFTGQLLMGVNYSEVALATALETIIV